MIDECLDAVTLTRSLVRIPSENPNGSEAAVASFVRSWLSKLPNVTVESREVRPDRPNVVGRLRGTGEREPLVILAHMDTVPIGTGWSVDPFAAELQHECIVGRGACDMKSGLAVAMVALAHAAAAGRPPARDIVVWATMDEEGTHMLGANDLVEAGLVDSRAHLIATEPSDLKVAVAHKGLLWAEILVKGRPAHAGNPQFGVDAIRCAAEFIRAFGEAIRVLPYDHPTLGRPTVTFSRIEGGTKTNVVPESARLELDIRLPPPMTLAQAHALLADAAGVAEAAVPGAVISIRQMNNDRPPVEADQSHPFVQALAAAVTEVTGETEVFSAFPAYTDASVVQSRTGNPTCLVFGPGLLAQAHTIDEFVAVDQIERSLAVLDRLIGAWCFA